MDLEKKVVEWHALVESVPPNNTTLSCVRGYQVAHSSADDMGFKGNAADCTTGRLVEEL